MERTWDITKAESLPQVAKELLAFILANYQPKQAAVVALHGDLGAGKTTFVQVIGQILGVKEAITSPTFVVMKKYEIDETWKKFIHIDAYRIASAEELVILNLAEEILSGDNIIFIEWAERVAEIFPANTTHLNFSLVDNQRSLKYNYGSE